MPKTIMGPCCEHCRADLSIASAGDFIFIIARFNQDKRVFQDVPSKKFFAKGQGPHTMSACSLQHAQAICPSGHFIVRVDRGEADEPPIDSWSAAGQHLGRFWLQEAAKSS